VAEDLLEISLHARLHDLLRGQGGLDILYLGRGLLTFGSGIPLPNSCLPQPAHLLIFLVRLAGREGVMDGIEILPQLRE
jgi:hypothetical protein